MGGRRMVVVSALVLTVTATLMPVGQAQSTYFPPIGGGWATTTVDSLGWDTRALDEVFDYARREKSTAFLVLHDGRLVAERYWRREDVPRVTSTSEGWPVEDVQSLQKSFISLIVGVAVDRGLLDREAPVSKYLGVGWSRADLSAESGITINHLLSMTSGLNDALESVGPAGSRWYYNTPAYSQLIKVLAAVTGKDVNAYSAEWLTSSVGMEDTRWIVRQGTALNPYGLATTARDLARMGLLVLRNGMWAGKRIVSVAYLRDATRPSQTLNPSYGLLWWANGQGSRVDRSVESVYAVPAAPVDLVAGLGAGDRKVYVVPSRDLVVVRLGAAVSPARRFDRELWDQLAKVIR